MDGGSLAQVPEGVGPGIWNRPNPGAQTIEIAGIVLKQAWLESAELVNLQLWMWSHPQDAIPAFAGDACQAARIQRWRDSGWQAPGR